jgi:hypothetical protein
MGSINGALNLFSSQCPAKNTPMHAGTVGRAGQIQASSPCSPRTPRFFTAALGPRETIGLVDHLLAHSAHGIVNRCPGSEFFELLVGQYVHELLLLLLRIHRRDSGGSEALSNSLGKWRLSAIVKNDDFGRQAWILTARSRRQFPSWRAGRHSTTPARSRSPSTDDSTQRGYESAVGTILAMAACRNPTGVDGPSAVQTTDADGVGHDGGTIA